MKYENTVKDLKAAFEAFNVKHNFKSGDIVKWKEGLKNKKNDGPFIVVDVLSTPIFDEDTISSGSPYFKEPLDLLLGSIDTEIDRFLIYHYDSRRFEPIDKENQ